MSVEYIDLKQRVLDDNAGLADKLRKRLALTRTCMINIMAGPGAGKTTFIVDTIRRLKSEMNIAVIEGDIESTVDSEKIQREGVAAVQLRTGGDCHLDAAMVNEGMAALDLERTDLVIVENIGNLVCPAEFDLGASLQCTILSVPEGDDKPIKYPLMYSVCDALVISKTDTLPMFDFDMEKAGKAARKLNPNLKVFPVSVKQGSGMEEWCEFLREKVHSIKEAEL